MAAKTKVKAGAIAANHNEAQVRATAREFRVQTNVKAGHAMPCPPPKGQGGPVC
jgi:hypothetical protein